MKTEKFVTLGIIGVDGRRSRHANTSNKEAGRVAPRLSLNSV